MNIELLLKDERKNCCGCGACENICPADAIVLVSDETGFLYPKVDIVKCIECRNCIEACNYKKLTEYVSKEITYAAVTQNTDVYQSSSGGLFSSLAVNVLAAGGTVYGCTMTREDDGFNPHHIRISRVEDLSLLQGSKYVQSEIGKVFRSVSEDLTAGKTVLFSGTPCQIDGLYGYLGKDWDNLYTIDTICHGVPGRTLFNEYIHYEENRRNGRINNFIFRDKSSGWKLFGRMDLYQNNELKQIYFEPEQSSYYQLFLNKYTYRENCYSCPFASRKRPGDITMGDFWNIDLAHPELNGNSKQLNWQNGVSALIINTDQGMNLMEQYGKDLSLYSSEYDRVAKYNRQLSQPSTKPDDYDEFRKICNNDYRIVEQWYQRKMRPVRIRRTVSKMVPSGIKKIVRKLRKGK